MACILVVWPSDRRAGCRGGSFSAGGESRGKLGEPDEFAQDLADLAEIEARFEMLDKVEDVALGIALRVPPASALVVENEDLRRFRAGI